MKYLKIQNDGVLDIRLVALMGGTTKENDSFKIGQFGTGLKYTLAFLIRNNLDFKIFAGEQEVRIATDVENIRGEDFEIICIDGHRTSITTKMGIDWQAWMIIRELWCNALDEGGQSKEVVNEITAEYNKTTFYVQIDSQIQDVLDNWIKYFIHTETPLYKDDERAIYSGGESLRIYKNGVLIFEDKKAKAIFSYDIFNASINELRQFTGSYAQQISYSLANADVKTALYFIDNVKEESYEATLDLDWFVQWKDSWKEALGSAKIITLKTLQRIKDRGITPDEKCLVVLPENIVKVLSQQIENISATRLASKIHEFYVHYDKRTEQRIKEALAILESCEYVMHPDLTFSYGFFEDKQTQARCDIDNKSVLISNTVFNSSLFDIVSTLIEENEHYNTGLGDMTRGFQQHFINLFTREMLSKNNIQV